jgi:hypothetical protein
VQFKVGDGDSTSYFEEEPVRRRAPVSRVSIGAGRPPLRSPAARPAKAMAPPATSASTATTAAAMIPFDDDDGDADDVLNSF